MPCAYRQPRNEFRAPDVTKQSTSAAVQGKPGVDERCARRHQTVQQPPRRPGSQPVQELLSLA
eukprot:2160288-Amphidinium_carterae.2